MPAFCARVERFMIVVAEHAVEQRTQAQLLRERELVQQGPHPIRIGIADDVRSASHCSCRR